MRQNVVSLVLRLPPEDHARLTEAAKNSLRSLNSEMVFRLKQSLARKPAGRPRKIFQAEAQTS
jgi:hypothetical protein